MIDQNPQALGPYYHLAKHCPVSNPCGQWGHYDILGEGGVGPCKCLVSLSNGFANQVHKIYLHRDTNVRQRKKMNIAKKKRLFTSSYLSTSSPPDFCLTTRSRANSLSRLLASVYLLGFLASGTGTCLVSWQKPTSLTMDLFGRAPAPAPVGRPWADRCQAEPEPRSPKNELLRLRRCL